MRNHSFLHHQCFSTHSDCSLVSFSLPDIWLRSHAPRPKALAAGARNTAVAGGAGAGLYGAGADPCRLQAARRSVRDERWQTPKTHFVFFFLQKFPRIFDFDVACPSSFWHSLFASWHVC